MYVPDMHAKTLIMLRCIVTDPHSSRQATQAGLMSPLLELSAELQTSVQYDPMVTEAIITLSILYRCATCLVAYNTNMAAHINKPRM